MVTSITTGNNPSRKPMLQMVAGIDSRPESSLHIKSEKSLSEQLEILTHGYVHGHIHKHKDHTHIHGHIHNHDHDQHYHESTQSGIESARGKSTPVDLPMSIGTLGNLPCTEMEDLSFCKDVFCDDLDDCFFTNCDNDNDSCCMGDPSCSGNCWALDNKDIECCNDPNCEDYTPKPPLQPNIQKLSDLSEQCNEATCCEYTASPSPAAVPHHHEQDHLCQVQSSKRSLFEDLITNVHTNLNNTNKTKPTEFEIHFPHECHAEESKPSNHHHFHQSCFHTTIPETIPSSSTTSYDEKLMSNFDYDFVVEFNNFNQTLALADQATTGISNSSEDPLMYSCQWDHCFKKVTDDSILNHVMEDHIRTEYPELPSDNTTYQCEWQDCNFINPDFKLLVDHLNVHKQQVKHQQPTVAVKQALLTPSSTIKSYESSPITEYPQVKDEHPNVNITSMKIMPKRRRPSPSPPDATHTCKWEIGSDNNSNPIVCNKTHSTAAELQDHLLNDHIGSGKSKYFCNWVGCDRHMGKQFTQRQKLLRHIHIHTGYKPCQCNICGANFAVEAMLTQHIRIHSGEKPFPCSICGKRFATRSSLSIHNRVHTGEKPLVCKWPGCGKRFSESSNLTKHMKIHTKMFECEVCGSVFDKKGDYTKHLKTHE
ncbi:Zinc-responsive transcriptional regulator ZAP1 [Spathaspora sp. JA1]|nr:Zinc-responsive transcriptional regulator ZAP1 [Spathaspora sp. JA1]